MKTSPATFGAPSRGRRAAARNFRFAVFYGMLLGMGAMLILQLPARLGAMEKQKEYDQQIYDYSELYAEIFKRIKNDYVEDVDSQKLFEASINGMFEALDPHSSWLPPKDQEEMTRDTEGEYYGVGMHIALRPPRPGGILTVISPITGSPAQKAGVLPWDRVIAIDGVSTKDISLPDAVEKLTGPLGTKVKVQIWRTGEGKPLDFTIERAKIHVESVYWHIMDKEYGYLRLTNFQEDTAEMVAKALEEFNKAQVKGVVVDLRFNPGGLLDRAVEICDMFLKKDVTIVSIRGRDASNNRVFKSEHDATCQQPLVVLVNSSSASASEIFAGAIKDNGRGVIIGPAGENTYGKGSVQTISTLIHSLEKDKNGNPKENGIRLTTAKYYTPSGVSIHEVGIKPDISVDLPAGHERELATRGLLGDPNQDEPGSYKDNPLLDDAQTTGTPGLATPDATPEGTPVPVETPDEEAPHANEGNTSLIPLMKMLDGPLAAAPKKKTGPFHDIQLEEGLKYLKVFLVFQNKRLADTQAGDSTKKAE